MKKENFTLKLIEREIARLEAQSSSVGLSLNDVKALQILVSTGQSLVSAPAIEPDETEDQSRSDDEIMEALKKKE